MSDSTETLVVGAGPVGLFLAAELLRRGRRCVLVERALGPSTHTKALAIMPGTMEMFELAGIAQSFANAAKLIEVISRVLAHVLFAGGKGRMHLDHQPLDSTFVLNVSLEELRIPFMWLQAVARRYIVQWISRLIQPSGDTFGKLLRDRGAEYSQQDRQCDEPLLAVNDLRIRLITFDQDDAPQKIRTQFINRLLTFSKRL